MPTDKQTDIRSAIHAVQEQVRHLMLDIDDELASFEIGALISLSQTLAEMAKEMSTTSNLLRSKAAQELHRKGVKNGSVVGWNGEHLTVEVSNTPTRSAVKRDELFAEVERLLQDPSNRFNKATGEIAEYETVLIDTIKSAFRLEPRWAQITKLGIADDEYCSKSWSPTIKITETEAL